MRLKLAALLVSGSFLFGCASQTFTINGEHEEVPASQKSQHFFISGLG